MSQDPARPIAFPIVNVGCGSGAECDHMCIVCGLPGVRSPRICGGGTPLPNEGRISERVFRHDTRPTGDAAGLSASDHETGQSSVLVRPLRQTPDSFARQAVRRPARPVAPRRCRQGQAEGRHRDDARHPWRAGGLPHRHRPGLGHRRRRDGHVVDAGRTTLHHAGLGKLRRRLGHRRGQAAEARRDRHDRRVRRDRRPRAGGFRHRCRLHLERHDQRRASAERRCDRCGPCRPDHLRRDQRGLRAGPALGQARCDYLFLAEGDGRRGGAWHADPLPPRGGPAGKLHAPHGPCRRSSE
jgi:hypothetical protein